MRTSVAAFIDPRVGSYREGVQAEDSVGHVYDWDDNKKELINKETTTSFFKRLSDSLYGANQAG